MELKKRIITIYNLWNTIVCFILTIAFITFWFVFFWPNMIAETSLKVIITLTCYTFPVVLGIFVMIIFGKPIKIIYFNSKKIVFFTFFRKTISYELSSIVLCKKGFFYYSRMINQPFMKQYLECLEIHNNKANIKTLERSIVPFKYLFVKSKKKCKKRLENLLLFLNKINANLIEPGLLEELISKKDNYLKYGKLKRKIMYVQSDSSFEIIEK